jgi:two-component system OmpR family sensor kinase
MAMRLPIRLRLALAFAVGMAVVLACLGTFLYVRLGTELLASIDLGLRGRAQIVEAGIPDGSFTDQPSGLSDPDEAFAQVLDPSGAILESSPEVADAPLVGPADLHFRGPTFVNRAVRGLEDPARLLVVPVDGGRFVVVGATLSDRREALDQLLALFAIGGPVALVLMSLAGWALAGAALRPVERMRQEAGAISASEPERRLPVTAADDELRRLAITLNAMLDRLQDSLARERRFVDDASHELRTPLAILKGELDLALSRERSPAELEATLRRASAETDRLTSLADALLVFARSEDGQVPVAREDVSLSEVIEATVAGRRHRTRDARVTVEVDAPEELVRIDPVRVRQALENVLDNALRYSPPDSTIRIATARDDGFVRISVEDAGPGFSDGVVDRAFEPFTRTQGGDGGAGLGLAIVGAVAASHGGTATAENLPGGGARVTISLRT